MRPQSFRTPPMLALAAAVLLTTLLTTLLATPARADTTIPGGNIVNQTWTTAGSPYVLQGDITVPSGAFLTIQAGVTVRAQTGDAAASGLDTSRVEIIVQGDLTVNGTDASPVVFESTSTSASSWYGIRAASASGTVSITGATIRDASYGVAIEDGALTITASRLESNYYGVYAHTGTTSISSSLLLNNTGRGVYTAAGTTDLDHCTVYGNPYGVYGGGGTTTVRSSVVTNNSTGIRRIGGTLTVTYSDVWGNSSSDYNGASAGTGTIQANPLYVGSSNLRLTENSPARFGAEDGSDQGALPYGSDPTPGLYGTLWSDRSVPAGTTSVPGDLTVAPGVTLTLAAGATLSFAAGDIMKAYDDTSRAELRVFGSLVTEGTSTMPTVLRGTGSASSWYGITLEDGSTGSTLSGLTVQDASYGIRNYATSPGTVDRITLQNDYYGVYAEAGSLHIVNAVIQNNTGRGVYTAAGTTEIGSSTIYGNPYGVYGGGGTTRVFNSIVTNNSTGIRRIGGTVTVTYSDVWGNTSSDYNGASGGTGCFSTNPFFAGAPSD